MAFLIIITGLWLYPIISYFLLKLTKKKPAVRKWIFYVSFVIFTLTLAGLLTSISTTLDFVDWLFLSSIYFTISLSLWWIQFQTNKILKFVGKIVICIVFGIGYFFASIGISGIGFIIDGYETFNEKWLGNGLIYKENGIGNALTDYRGKRVEIFKTIPWFPLIEWCIQEKEYFGILVYKNVLTIDYYPDKNEIYLSASGPVGEDRHIESWKDTLVIDNKLNATRR
jgi:hypothetical protein